ncbi:hypothetical protein SNEBB_002054 [Seison nebaliae]|nr:hypothetical protein SNEBB_002054 [Seison nebaliae]
MVRRKVNSEKLWNGEVPDNEGKMLVEPAYVINEQFKNEEMEKKKKAKGEYKNKWNSVEEFVEYHNGTKPIKRLLIANNGLAAVKAIKSLRQWALRTFYNEKNLTIIVMYTPEDLNANAQYIRLADVTVAVPSGSNNNNYANVELIVNIALREKADAVWAGWGHASENPKLPELLQNNGIIFCGPHQRAMWALGDKIASTIIAQSVNVPTVPWSGSGIQLPKDIDLKNSTVPDDIFQSACVNINDNDIMNKAEKIGFPLMIKASEGGGGKGIRLCQKSSDFLQQFRQVMQEVPASPIFLMKLASNCRHLEVQLLGDAHGNIVSLFGRDCSVQRRHQKIIEEAPAIIAPISIRKEMEKNAVDLAVAVNYSNAGTVEYLYDSATKKYCFLELNPRLQVEHPCTEAISGVNLPACQLMVAMGIPLGNISDIYRLFSKNTNPFKGSVLEDVELDKKSDHTHVIACRLTAENPDTGFQPMSGELEELNFRSSPNAWAYFSIGVSGSIHEYADSQFGHCFAFGHTRDEARLNMILTLKQISIRSQFRHTVPYLIYLLQHEEFKDLNIHTGWLDKLLVNTKKLTYTTLTNTLLQRASIAALHVGMKRAEIAKQTFTKSLERGQLHSSLAALASSHMIDLIGDGKKFAIRVTCTGPHSYFLVMNHSFIEIDARNMSDGSLLVKWENRSYSTFLHEDEQKYTLSINNEISIFEKENDPTIMRSPTAGKLIQYLVEDNAHVFQNDAYCEIEVMKMIMEVRATASGLVKYVKRPGAILETGSIIATLQLDDVGKIQQAEIFTGSFPNATIKSIFDEEIDDESLMKNIDLHLHIKSAIDILENILDGHSYPERYVEDKIVCTIEDLMIGLKNPSLPLLELRELMAISAGRLPNVLENAIKQLLAVYHSNLTSVLVQFPADKILQCIEQYMKMAFNSDRRTTSTSTEISNDSNESSSTTSSLSLNNIQDKQTKNEELQFMQLIKPIMELADRYRNGIQGHTVQVIRQFIQKYLSIEEKFQNNNFEKSVEFIRLSDIPSDELTKMLFSHSNLLNKNLLIVHLLNQLISMVPSRTDDFTPLLLRLTQMTSPKHSRVALRARQILIMMQLPPYEQRHNQMESIFLSAINSYGQTPCEETLKKLIVSETSLYDVLQDFFFHSNIRVRQAALEVYVRRSYIAYELHSIHHHLSMIISEADKQGQRQFNDENRSIISQRQKLRTESICSESLLEKNRENEFIMTEFKLRLPESHPHHIRRNESSHRRLASLGGMRSHDIIDDPVSVNNNNNSNNNLTTSNSNGDGSDNFSLFNIQQSSLIFQRKGIIAAFPSLDTMIDNFETTLQKFSIKQSSTLMGENSLSAISTQTDNHLNHHSGSQLSLALSDRDEPMNLLHICIRAMTSNELRNSDNDWSSILQQFIKGRKQLLNDANIRRVTFIIAKMRQFPLYFTFRARDHFVEDRIYRHLEPALAFQLEISRLRNFDLEAIQTTNHKIHLYMGKAKKKPLTDIRFFARSIVRNRDLLTKEASFEYIRSEAERTLLEAMDELDLAFTHPEARKSDYNHIFMCFVPTVSLDESYLQETVKNMILTYGPRIWKLRILHAELKFCIRDGNGMRPIRCYVKNDNGIRISLSMYDELTDETTGQTIFSALNKNRLGVLHNKPINTPYEIKDDYQQRRFQANKLDTTFVKDFPEMFRNVNLSRWRIYSIVTGCSLSSSMSFHAFSCKSLILRKKEDVEIGKKNFDVDDYLMVPVDVNDEEALNQKIGMVAWLMNMKTPEAPNGRQIIVIANDITYQIGSFGTLEDILYLKASQLARSMRIPRIYISANSGARIGLSESMKSKFHICWRNEQNPDEGFDYLYLEEEEYEELVKLDELDTLNLELIELSDDKKRYKIKSIIGKEKDLGVENLSGSGLIAGETMRAYEEIPTISLVTCRAIGIGAYIVRLSERIIQTDSSHIILTGAAALNKVLGDEVYTSNSQLGGIQIMHNNGVTHTVVLNDYEGVLQLLVWLSYVPCRMSDICCPLLSINDPINRKVNYIPSSNSTYDSRWLLAGKTKADECSFCNQVNSDVYPISSEYAYLSLFNQEQQTGNGKTDQPFQSIQSGFFDRNSFVEIMKIWARTVIVGRARLGGIPCGVISVEVRTVKKSIPADPANSNSEASIIQQAGQVWYPDSAFKTAQSLKDFQREKLPIFIFANWRGFSGGMKDMYDQVLKFGAMIVEALVEYTQPIFIYLPPYSEVRGGAWAVIDSTINKRYMEMYADPTARAGVLEPEGTVEIKYREKDLVKTMARLDRVCSSFKQDIEQLQNSINIVDDDQKKKMLNKRLEEKKNQLQMREINLMSSYRQAAVRFADLHDSADRMLSKKVIRKIVDWKNSRQFFYYRLKRLQLEQSIIDLIVEKNETYNSSDWNTIRLKLKELYKNENFDDNDKEVDEWYLEQIDLEDHQIIGIKSESSLQQLIRSEAKDEELLENLKELVGRLKNEKNENFELQLKNLLNELN